jgi:hypothetical protein
VTTGLLSAGEIFRLNDSNRRSCARPDSSPPIDLAAERTARPGA